MCVISFSLLSVLTVEMPLFTNVLVVTHQNLNTRLVRFFCCCVFVLVWVFFVFVFVYFYLEIPIVQNSSSPVVETRVAEGFCQGHDQSSPIKDIMEAESWAQNQIIEGKCSIQAQNPVFNNILCPRSGLKYQGGKREPLLFNTYSMPGALLRTPTSANLKGPYSRDDPMNGAPPPTLGRTHDLLSISGYPFFKETPKQIKNKHKIQEKHSPK